MTTTAARRHYCSCSDLPRHLQGVSLERATYVAAEDPVRRKGSEGVAARFCTCSKTPVRRVDGADVELEVGDEAEEQNLATSEVAERMNVASPAPQAVTPNADETSSLPNAGDVQATGAEPALKSVSDLFPGESTVDSVSTHGKGGSEVVLTNRRVLLRGAPEAKVLHASMPLAEIDSLAISRARPSKRSLAWGLIGIGASIGMWQALDGVGNMRLIIGAVVVLMSGLLLADYFLRPPDLQVVFRSHSGAEMIVEFGQSHADEADRFAAQVLAKLENSHTH